MAGAVNLGGANDRVRSSSGTEQQQIATIVTSVYPRKVGRFAFRLGLAIIKKLRSATEAKAGATPQRNRTNLRANFVYTAR